MDHSTQAFADLVVPMALLDHVWACLRQPPSKTSNRWWFGRTSMKTETDLYWFVVHSSSIQQCRASESLSLSLPLFMPFPKAKKCAKVGWRVFPRKASCPTWPTPGLPWSCSTPTPRHGWCCTAGLTDIHPWPGQRCRSVARPWPVPVRAWCRRRCTVLCTTCGSVAMMRFWAGIYQDLLFFILENETKSMDSKFDTKYTVIWVHAWEHILVGGLEHFIFFHILGIIIPTD